MTSSHRQLRAAVEITAAVLDLILALFSKVFLSFWFAPTLLILANLPVLQGGEAFHHDTGDGIAAFKFVGVIPRLWNWFENAGQPFWHDLTIFRFHDPLVWPVLLPLKVLPLEPYLAYTLFILIRIWTLGLGTSLLLNSLGFSKTIRQVGAFIALFGSLGASVYEQWGMLDIAFPFLFLLWALIRLVQTREGKYLAVIGVLLIHGVYNYHILLLGPTFFLIGILVAIFFRNRFVSFIQLLMTLRWRVLFVLFTTGLAGTSAYLSAKRPELTPILRNVEYGSHVDNFGNNTDQTIYQGVNVFDSSRLESSGVLCGVNTFCSEYHSDYLSVFYKLLPWDIHPWGESIGFVGRLALLIALIGACFGRRPLSFLGLALLFSSYGLSLGSKSFLWPLVKNIFPLLSVVRHSHFYLAIMVLALIFLTCLGLEVFQRWATAKNSWLNWKTFFLPTCLLLYWVYQTTEHIPYGIHLKDWPIVFCLGVGIVVLVLVRRGCFAMLISIMVLEILIFQFSFGRHYKRPLRPVQRELINRSLGNSFINRAIRFYNPYPFPRSALSTVFNFPTAIEPVSRKILQRSSDDAARPYDIRTIGNVTPFVLTYTLKARLALSERGEEFKRAFGVMPYSILSVKPKRAKPEDRGDGFPLQINGNNLLASVTVKEPSRVYLSVPYPYIVKVLVNGDRVAFSQDHQFGLGFDLEAGRYDLEVFPTISGYVTILNFFYLGSLLAMAHLFLSFRAQLHWNFHWREKLSRVFWREPNPGTA